MIKISQPNIGAEEIRSVEKVLKSGMIIQGKLVKKLENLFCETTGAKYSVAINSGTAALHTALHAIGIKKDDEVITTSFTFVATANAILMVGAKPIFVDIDEKTFNIDPKKIEEVITKKTKAIIVVDLYGQPADYKEINKIAKKYNLFVVADAAQSIGAKYHDKMTGNLADISCFSLYATKNIMCGEGGMITTNNRCFSERARMFRHHGQREDSKYKYYGIGFNYRLMDVQAAIALPQLKKIRDITKQREKNAFILNTGLKDLSGITLPIVNKNRSHAFHQYTIRITKEFKITRDAFKEHLTKQGIQANIYYPTPLYRFKHFRCEQHGKNFPITNKLAREVISLPVHPLLKETEIRYMIKTIKNL